jgi:ATP-binding cassette subfamily C (CFTR/MRP) protein 1
MNLLGKLRPVAKATTTSNGLVTDKSVTPMQWKVDPEMSSSFLSKITFHWIQPMFSRATYLRKNDLWLEHADLAPLAQIDKTENVEKMFEDAYEAFGQKKQKKKSSDVVDGAGNPVYLERRLVHALLSTCWRRIIVGGYFRFINSALQFSYPIFLNLILGYYQDVQSGVITKDDPPAIYYKGYWLSTLLMLFVALKALTESAYFHNMNRCSWRVKTAVSASVYRKSLRLASSAQQQTTVGEIVNLMQVDATKIEAFMLQLHVMWDGLFQITGYIVILGFLLGWTCLVGLAIIILAVPVMGKITGKMFGLNRSMVKYTDERVKTVNEAMQGVLCVKMYSWEDPLSKQIDTFRQQELSSLKRIAYLRAFTRAYMSALPIIAAAATFFVYVYATDRSVSASILFSSLLAFDMLRMPLMFYPMALAQYAQCKVSLKRVAVFLGHNEVNQMGYTRAIDDAGEIKVENATLYWSDPNKPLPRSAINRASILDTVDESSSRGKSISRSSSKSSLAQENTVSEEEEMMFPKPVLQGVNLRVKPGELCAIVGPVGSGKSTICASILNEAVLGEGSHVTLKGRVAYVAQTAWILNKTVRDNILFGLPYDEDRYNKVLETCCLTHDLKILEEGDMTEIGERGINLSGGELLDTSLD